MSNRLLAFTAERLRNTLESFPTVNAYIIGFSGGADSTALLHALGTLQDQLTVPVSAVHINHGLHHDADLWQSHCEAFCRQISVHLVCLRVAPKNCSGKGLEAEARHLRYEAISTLIKPGAGLLTGHHADDQAETLLLNLMRGSGVDGLSAMPESRPLGEGLLQRPLLGFQNSVLKDYLREHSIDWIEDPSNQHLDHDRNFMRHEVIPLLEQRWPEVHKRLALTCKAMTGARHLLERFADNYVGQNLIHPFVMGMTPQLSADEELFKLVIRRWLKQSGAPSIPFYRMEAFCQQSQQAGNDHKVAVRWEGWTLHLYDQRLWLHKGLELPPCPVIDWPAEESEIDLGNDVGRLALTGCKPGFPDGIFSVGNRSATDQTAVNLGGQHKRLKALFQTAGIPPWLRDSIPLTTLNGELVAVGDWCFNDSFANWLIKKQIKLNWYPQHPLLQYILTQQHPDMVDPAGAVR